MSGRCRWWPGWLKGICRLLTACFLLCPAVANAQRLPITTYTISDGLAHYSINRIVRDSRGFLWFCTRQGLSRFDGREFVNFGTDHGLPSAIVNDIVEADHGIYWVATAGGLARFDPRGRPAGGNPALSEEHDRPPMFTLHTADGDPLAATVQAIGLDRSGDLWMGTAGGLYRVRAADGRISSTLIDLGIPDQLHLRAIGAILVDKAGAVWAAANRKLYRRTREGRIDPFGEAEGIPPETVNRILEDREGRIWLATRIGGLRQFTLGDPDRTPRLTRVIDEHTGLPTPWVTDLLQDDRGSLWAATVGSLVRIDDRKLEGAPAIEVIDEADGLPGWVDGAIGEDRHGNVTR